MPSVLEKTGIAPEMVKAVVFNTQWKAAIPIDAEGNILHNAVIWLDGRARKQAEELLRQGEETVQKIRTEAEEKAKQAADACMEKARKAGEEALEKAAGEIGAETAELRKQVEKKLPDAAEAVKKLILGD
jgi:glycerol kinase